MRKTIIISFLCCISAAIIGTAGYFGAYNYFINSHGTYTPGKYKVEIPTQALQPEEATKVATNVEIFYIGSEFGLLVIYDDKGQVYDRTNIPVSILPREDQIKVLNMMKINSKGELYDFLESYSS